MERAASGRGYTRAPMNAARIPRTLAAPLRSLLALWLVCGLLLAPVQAAQHALAMALGADICSAADQAGLGGTAAAHDCCVGGLVAAAPPALPALPERLPAALPQAAALPGGMPAARPACPPARGPPAEASLPPLH